MKELSKIVSTPEANQIVEALKEAKRATKECQHQEKVLTQKLYNYMNEHDVLIDCETGQETISWTYSSGFMKFDTKKFMADRPKVYEKYCFMTDPIRTLRIAK